MNRSRRVVSHLRALEKAVTRDFRDFLDPESPWPAAFFSDTLVLASPVLGAGDEEDAIGGLVVQAAYLQLNLIARGFFMRGGLSFGRFYIRDGLLFGPALLEAADLEHDVAVHPRIVLSDDAVAAEVAFLRYYASPAASPQQMLLMRDEDGKVFVNYLSMLLDEIDPRTDLAWHRDVVIERLSAHRGDRRRWEKYRWVGEYHNAFAKNFFSGTQSLRIPQRHLNSTFAPFA